MIFPHSYRYDFFNAIFRETVLLRQSQIALFGYQKKRIKGKKSLWRFLFSFFLPPPIKNGTGKTKKNIATHFDLTRHFGAWSLFPGKRSLKILEREKTLFFAPAPFFSCPLFFWEMVGCGLGRGPFLPPLLLNLGYRLLALLLLSFLLTTHIFPPYKFLMRTNFAPRDPSPDRPTLIPHRTAIFPHFFTGYDMTRNYTHFPAVYTPRTI